MAEVYTSNRLSSPTHVPRSISRQFCLIITVLLFGLSPTVLAGTPVLGDWYVDFSNAGIETGVELQPFNTLSEALAEATAGQTIAITPQASHETPTITQAVTLVSMGGVATLGDLGSPYGSGTPYEALKITEIMYNPALGEAEYIELQNTSGQSIDVSGVYFSDGITYTFPASTVLTAGEHIVLVRDTDEAIFISDYPSVTPLGVYGGALNNGGETISLSEPGTQVFLTLTYSDGASWPDLADGVGFSLVIINPHGNGSDAANWRASSSSGGSPGEVDVTIAIPGIVINEALTHTDLPDVDTVEFYNPTGAPVDIRGWFLSDNRKEPFRAKIPDDPAFVIPDGGYAVIDEDDFFLSPGSVGATPLVGFQLNSHGDDIFLFSSDGSDNLTGYAHGWGFEGAENSVSFGRFITSDGREHFVAQQSNSLGSANGLPKVGPLVISELHYNALSNGVEYLKITNTSGSTVNLYDDSIGGDVANTYKISGIGFQFPVAQSMLTGASVLVVNTAPATYISRFGDPGIPVYGPFGNDPLADSDSLSNAGETVQINWPDTPDEIPPSSGNFVAPYISMDKVRYNDKSPWPTLADGTGKSMTRVVNTTFGSEPTNWADSAPSTQPEFQVDDVIFSTLRGFYDGTVNLTLSTTTGSSTIYYTTDGTVPTPSSTEYTTTIAITTNTPIRATAIRASYIDAPVETHTYIMNAPAHQKNVPALTIVGDPQESLYHPNGVMAINNGAYHTSTFNTLIWGPYTYNTSATQLNDPNTGQPWFDPLGNAVYPLVGLTGNPYSTSTSAAGATVDATAYHHPAELATQSMEKPASFEMLYPDGSPGLQEDAGVRVAGSSFHRPRYAAHPDGSGDWTTVTSASIGEATLASYLKFSLRMYFRGEYGASKLKWPIFPGDALQSYDKIVLRGGHNDGQNPFIKDELTRRLALDTGTVSARGGIFNLYINGVYKGWYNATERLDSKFFQSRYGGTADYDRMVHVDDKVAQRYDESPWVPELKEGDFDFYHAMMLAVDEDLSVQGNYDAVAAMLDIPHFIDYVLVQLYVGNDDWPNNNWTGARERVAGAKFRFYVWDAESTFLTANTSKSGLRHFPFWMWTDPTPPGSVSGGGGLFGEQTPIAAIFRGLYANAGFRTQFSDRAVVLLDNATGPLGDTNVDARYQELRTEIVGTLKPSLTFSEYIGSNWIPGRRATLIGILQADGLYPS